MTGCVERGLEPLVTLHHFTHPDWLGDDFWLRPDAPDRFRGWAEVAVDALAPLVRHWVTINEINVLSIGSWLLGMFPPGRLLGFGDAAIAVDNLLAAHVAAYEVIHRMRPDAVVTTNNSCMSLYEYDRLLIDLLLARSMGVERDDVGGWLAEPPPPARRPAPAGRNGRAPAAGVQRGEGALRRRSDRSPPVGGWFPLRSSAARSAESGGEAVYDSPHERTLDVIGLDYYDPVASRHFRLPGHRTAGGRNRLPARELWDDVPDPGGLTRWLQAQQALAPGMPFWVVENGMCNRVRQGRSHPAPGRMGPSPLSAREPRRGGGRGRRGRSGPRLLALVAGRQLRVGVVRAAVRPLRGRPPPRRARNALAGDRLARGRCRRHLPPDHRRAAVGDRSVFDER